MRAVCFAVLAACAFGPRPPPAPPRQSSVGLAISTLTLADGLRVVLVDDPHATEVQVTMRYQVGAVDDAERPGLAHFVEHVMFQQMLDGQPLFTHLEDVATYFNANTTYDATTYVARARPDRLAKLLSIEAARMAQRCATVSDAAFAREREVVTNELRQRDQVSEVFTAIHSVLYPPGHPYRQSIGGTVESIATITREHACKLANATYAPGNAVLVISSNLPRSELDRALTTFAAAVPRRPAATRAALPRLAATPHHLEVSAPLDEDVLVLAWPLPLDPELQSRVRAIAAALPRLVDAEIKGRVVAVEFGDGRAPMWGLAVVPGDGETFQQAVDGTRKGIEALPAAFRDSGAPALDDVLFDRIRESGVYDFYSSLEDGAERDAKLASYVLAERDPNRALRAELIGVQRLTRDAGERLALQYLAVNLPTVVTLKANAGKKRGRSVTLRTPIHDMGGRRTLPDPAQARRPSESPRPRDVVGMRTRVLPNGLKIVLLPVTSVPTLDIRLVFGSGTADEPLGKRGVALLAAHTLTWDMHYLNDLLEFADAGGMHTADVGTDRTTFAAQGIDAHLDVLLAGLRRWVREGTYDEDAASTLVAMRRAAKRTDDEGVLTDTWRAALFGTRHPYVEAGLVRHANNSITLDDAAAFRGSHYTPDNATLVIAGHFDPALADRWIDYLFADWAGRASTRQSPRGAAQPASIAKAEDLAMLQLRIALPASASARAAQLVAAEMLSQIAGDVRKQLGASYTLDAQLSESRLASFYVIGGWIDPARSAAAIQLIRDRIQRLRTSADAAARAFVVAREHVLTQLAAHVGSAAALASRVEHDIEMQRAPLSDLQTAVAVQALTIDAMTETLSELDLSRAAVLVRGPGTELKTTFDALGRKPSFVQAEQAVPVDTAAAPGNAAPIGTTTSSHVRMADVEPALTEQPPPLRTLSLVLGTSAGHVGSTDVSGYTLAADAGVRYRRHMAFGGHLELGEFPLTYYDAMGQPQNGRTLPGLVAAFWRYEVFDLVWAELFGGLHVDRVRDATTRWHAGFGVGLQLGVDLWRFSWGRIGIALRRSATLLGGGDYAATTFGIVVRE